MKDENLNSGALGQCESSNEDSNERTDEVRQAGTGKGRKSRKKPELPERTKVSAGQVVAIRRRELCWSQEELCWRSGLSRNQIGRIERNECIPSTKSIEGLESALEIELYDLFMAQKREQEKNPRRKTKARGSKDVINKFEKELARKKLGLKELEQLLTEVLRSAGEEPNGSNGVDKK